MRTRRNKISLVFRFMSMTVAALGVSYLVLLYFPQPLFAYSTQYESFQIHSRQPIQPELNVVLNSVEARLKKSPIYDGSTPRHVYLTDSYGTYALLSHKAYKSFANSVPFINNIIINKSDIASDRVFMNRELNNSRSLSGVIAHEVTHLLIRQRYGTVTASMMPTWKNEGYCEYIAGDTTITLEEGINRWRENPANDSNYRYIKYQLMVKQLLENERVSVEELFTRSFDEKEVAERTFAAITAE